MGKRAVDTTGELDGLRAWRSDVCAAFVDAHYHQVYRFFQWLTGESETAADLTQETFTVFWESIGRIDTGSVPDLKAWLFGIARNRWRKRMRDRTPACDDLEAGYEVADAAPGPDEIALAQWDTERVLQAVGELPPDLREALVLRVFQELDYPEIAGILGISLPLARWRVHRARQRLRIRLVDGNVRKEMTGAGRD